MFFQISGRYFPYILNPYDPYLESLLNQTVTRRVDSCPYVQGAQFLRMKDEGDRFK